MMIECEVKTEQTVESIKHTRREAGETVIVERLRRRMKRGMGKKKRV